LHHLRIFLDNTIKPEKTHSMSPLPDPKISLVSFEIDPRLPECYDGSDAENLVQAEPPVFLELQDIGPLASIPCPGRQVEVRSASLSGYRSKNDFATWNKKIIDMVTNGK
jgi:hypothetical protein